MRSCGPENDGASSSCTAYPTCSWRQNVKWIYDVAFRCKLSFVLKQVNSTCRQREINCCTMTFTLMCCSLLTAAAMYDDSRHVAIMLGIALKLHKELAILLCENDDFNFNNIRFRYSLNSCCYLQCKREEEALVDRAILYDSSAAATPS